MSALSPTAEGFRAAFRRPSLALGEISWRWITGATATALFLFGLFEYLDTLPVSNVELLLLRSRQPYLVAQAISHILRGSRGRVVASSLVAVLLLSFLWIIAGSLGRIATVRAMLDYFQVHLNNDHLHRDVAGKVSTAGAWNTLVRLNFLRTVVALASLIGLAGATIIAGFVSPDSHPRPGMAFLLFLPLAALVCLAWSSLNWLLSLAGMFAVRDGGDAIGAIAAAVGLCRDRMGPVAAVSSWTGLAHLVAFVGMSTVISMPLGFLPLVTWRLVVVTMFLITLVYFALADWLYTARLAGYVCISEMPEAMFAPPPLPPRPPALAPPFPVPIPPSATPVEPVAPLATTIDRDEVILSDMPGNASQEPPVDAARVTQLVEFELSKINDLKLLTDIRKQLVSPYPVERNWDYGGPDERYTCWTVLEHRDSNTGIAYCASGFGPRDPWGLIFLSGPQMSIGMDSGWFTTLESAFRESMAWDESNPRGYEVP